MMKFIIEIFSGNFSAAIGWTIFHSFWQGILISLILGISILVVNNKSAKFRYAIGVASLLLVVISSAITFYKTYNTSPVNKVVNSIPLYNNNDLFEPAFSPAVTDNSADTIYNYLNNAEQFFAKYISFIAALWFVGLMIFSIRFTGGFLYMSRLRRKDIIPIDKNVLERLGSALNKINFKRKIEFCQSAFVNVPIAFGFFKPIILLPLGFFSGLPQNQIEAIIMHEIAHIRRYDYIVNIIQNITETIFFYHPAVWWISSVIRNERENCCDDFAVEICGNAVSYSNALINIQQLNKNESTFALAIFGNDNKLFRRIKRMNENKKTQSAYGIKFTAFAFLAIFVGVVSIYSTNSRGYNSMEMKEASIINPMASINNLFETNNNLEYTANSIRDTVNLRKGKHTFRFNEKEDGERIKYKARLNNGKLEDLYIDDRQVPVNELTNYNDKINRKIDDYESAISELGDFKKEFKKIREENAEKMKELRNKLRNYRNYDNDFEFDEDGVVPDMSELREAMRELRHELRDSFAGHSFIIPPVPPVHVPDIDIPEIDVPEIHIPHVHIPPINITIPHINKGDMKEWKNDLKKNMEELKEKMKEQKWHLDAFGDSMKVFSSKMKIFGIEMKKFGKFIKAAKNEMIDDNLIDSGDDIEQFYLSEDKMTVNDKTVSPETHKKYLDMYEKYTGKKLTDDKKIEINDRH